MGIDAIEMVGGTYRWDNVSIGVDRTARPLTVRPAADGTVTFAGNGSTTGSGILNFGATAAAKWITFDGVAPGGFTFDSVSLAQVGVLSIRSSDHLTLRNMTFRNLVRDTAWAPKAYTSWAAYISTAGGRANSNLTLDHWTMTAPAVRRGVSFIQTDSSTATNTSIHLTNMTVTGADYAFYGGVPATDLVLDNWTIVDCGENGSSVRFANGSESGRYSNLHATTSDRLLNQSAGMVNGGGVVWR